MFDRDGSGQISFQEFGSLWRYIEDWQNTFRFYDRDNSGAIDQNELHTAINQFGNYFKGFIDFRTTRIYLHIYIYIYKEVSSSKLRRVLYQ